MLVHECMTADPETVAPDRTLEEVRGMTRTRAGTSSFLVVEEGRLVGLLTLADLARAGGQTSHSQVRVGDVMTRDPATVSPSAPVEVAAQLLAQHRLDALSVVDQGTPVGLVSANQLLGALVTLVGGDIGGVRMAVALPDGASDLHQLVDILDACGAPAAPFALIVRRDRLGCRARVRSAGSHPLTIVEAVAARGLAVSKVHMTPP